MSDAADARYRADDDSEGSGADYHSIVRLLESRLKG